MFKKFISILIFITSFVLVNNFKLIRSVAECYMGDSEMCEEKGKHYFSKSDSSSDLFISIQLLTKGCELESPESCAHLGMILMKKEGTINEAKEYLSKSCKLRSKKGCFGLGMIYEEVLNEKAKAQDAYNNSCRFGFKKACDIKLEI